MRRALPELPVAEQPIDAHLRSPITSRTDVICARSVAMVIGAVALPIASADHKLLVGLLILMAALAQPLLPRIMAERHVAWAQYFGDLQVAALVLILNPAFLPVVLIWFGGWIAWHAIASPRRTAALVAGVTAIEFGAIGFATDAAMWMLIPIAFVSQAAVFIPLGETLRRELRQNESALMDTLAAAGAVVHHSDLDSGTVTKIHGDLHSVTGWTADEWYSASHKDFIHPDDVDSYWIDVDKIEADTVVDRVARVRHADGSWVWLRDLSRISIERDGSRSLRGFSVDVTDLEVATRTLADQARIDLLTQLPNRWALTERLDALLVARRPFALIIFDLDRFKEVNDTLGHEAGDRVLEVMATRLGQMLDGVDLFARLGGDEFAIVVTDVTCESEIVDLLTCVAREGARPLTVGGVQVAMSFSTGVALSANGGADRATLMRHADIAMYDAKRKATGYRVFDGSLEQSSTMSLSLSAALPDAIRNGDLMLFFQPKFDLVTREIVGAEGLARWDHPEFGLLSPAAFLDIAVVSESSVDFAHSTIAHAARMMKTLSDLGHEMPIAANIALGALRTVDFADSILEIIDEHGARRDLLTIELTESDMQGPSRAIEAAIAHLADAGVQISIDDFGTGYSSLDRIRTFRVDELKVDHSFVSQMIDKHVERELVRSVIELAKSLDYRLVAEGVETEEEAQVLVEMGCRVAQGYLFSKPIRPEEFISLVTASGDRAIKAAVLKDDASDLAATAQR